MAIHKCSFLNRFYFWRDFYFLKRYTSVECTLFNWSNRRRNYYFFLSKYCWISASIENNDKTLTIKKCEIEVRAHKKKKYFFLIFSILILHIYTIIFVLYFVEFCSTDSAIKTILFFKKFEWFIYISHKFIL